MIIQIENLEQPGVDIFANLTESQLRFSYENKGGFFIAESPKVIERALDSGYQIKSFLMEEKHIKTDAAHLIKRCPQIPVYTAERKLLEQLTGYTLTRGVLAAFYRKEENMACSILKDAKRVVVLENITESTNMGAIFRSAAALGMDGVLLTPQSCDPLSRRSIRVSMGTVFQVKWARIGKELSDWPKKGLLELKEYGFKTLAMALRNNSIDIDDPRLIEEEKLAVILGTEGDGLARETIAASDYVAKIPMAGGVDSLNVASAGAVIFWQLRKR